jgi:Protein of unknown function (DUF1616)
VRVATILNREFPTLFLAFLVLASVVAWVVANPPANEDFASISVLGSRMSAAFYFPNNDTKVGMNEPIQWYVQVYNHEHEIQLFSVYVILANFTTTSPNATSNTPSGGTMLAQYYRALQNGDTWTIPLYWSITNRTITPGTVTNTTTIERVTVNNQVVNNTKISALGGTNFRIVIELWSYSLQSHGYIFSFMADGVVDSVFDQIWFNS